MPAATAKKPKCAFNKTSHKRKQGDGDHSHKCSSCGTTWSHQNATYRGSRGSHSCPCCGVVQYQIAGGGDSGPG